MGVCSIVCRHDRLISSEAQNANDNYPVQMAVWKVPRGEGPEQSWQVRLMLVALKRGYKWVWTGKDTDFRPGFGDPVVDANAKSIMKEPGQKILYQYRCLSTISSNPGTHIAADNLQPWAEISSK